MWAWYSRISAGSMIGAGGAGAKLAGICGPSIRWSDLHMGCGHHICQGRGTGSREEVAMAIVLDHTIVPARDKEASARVLARILGLRYQSSASHFAPLRINDTLTLDFDTDDTFESHHYAFKVGESGFDDIFGRVK